MKIGAALSVLALISACGGGGSNTSSSPPTATPSPPSPTPPPPPSSGGCSLRERQDWAASQINEWYLFPETLPANPSPSGFSSVEAYIDYLTATARAQGRDRHFTYLTSIAQEDAFFAQGSNAGFGIRLSIDLAGRRLFIAEAFEGAPALAAGIDRGTEIFAIGTSSSTLRTVSDIIATQGADGVTNALGPPTVGTTRVLQVSNGSGGMRTVTLTKAAYELLPVSPRYGAQIITDGARRIGYLNLRTFIETADPALRDAFAEFRAQGITEFIVDLRYNGGGLVSIAELMGDLLGRNRTSSEVFSRLIFRSSKSASNQTHFFQTASSSVAPVRIAFIGSEGTASASELVINGLIPYLGPSLALIGSDTYGKPVGQIAEDLAACDDRLRIMAFAVQNADGQGEYFDGLADTVEASCQAGDDVAFQLGDPDENSVATALDFLAGRSCTPIAGGTAITGQAVGDRPRRRQLLRPQRPSAAQIVSPGLF